MITSVIYQSTINSAITCKSLDECVALALANAGNNAYLSWNMIMTLTPIQ